MEALTDDQAGVGVLEGEVGRRSVRPGRAWNVKRFVQLLAQSLVVGPKGERIAELRRGFGVDEFERPTGVVAEFLQDPGLYLRTAIGECDLVQIVLDNGLLLGGGLPGGNGGCCGS